MIAGSHPGPEAVAAVTIAVGAAVTDLATRRVPNLLVLCGALCGVVLSGSASGAEGVAASLSGVAVGLLVFLPFCLLRGMGAGDVKLMGALGSCLGVVGILNVALGAAFSGAVLAIGMSAWQGRLGSTLGGSARLLGAWTRGRPRPSDEMTLDNPAALAIPYAVPIATGVIWAVVAG